MRIAAAAVPLAAWAQRAVRRWRTAPTTRAWPQVLVDYTGAAGTFLIQLEVGADVDAVLDIVVAGSSKVRRMAWGVQRLLGYHRVILGVRWSLAEPEHG